MKRVFSLILACGFAAPFMAVASELVGSNQRLSGIWGSDRITNIPFWKSGFGELWTYLQGSHYFSYGVAIAIIAMILAFGAHYMAVGPKEFDEEGGKVYAFSVFMRIVHLIAAVSWTVLIPTGVIMMWGESFGGGFFVRLMKNLHGIATILFAISIVPMFVAWFYRMLPRLYDIKWMLIVGGYLSKKKRPIYAGKYNAGQKIWFWVAMLGGAIMIVTGAEMYLLDVTTPGASYFGLTQIEVLRLCALTHNILGIGVAMFFLVHIYMAVFAIKGSIHSIITGYKPEEEVYILHHYWYQELLKKGKIQKSEWENVYPKLASIY